MKCVKWNSSCLTFHLKCICVEYHLRKQTNIYIEYQNSNFILRHKTKYNTFNIRRYTKKFIITFASTCSMYVDIIQKRIRNS